MTDYARMSITPKYAVIALMKGLVPERADEIASLWEKRNFDVMLVADTKRARLNGNKDCIEFDARTMDLFWLIGLAGWRAIKCYSPYVVLSARTGQRITDVIKGAPDLDDVERAYKDQRAAARALIEAANPATASRPTEVLGLTVDGNGLRTTPNRMAFDLASLALAFALFHELRHVMLGRDNLRPHDPWEEELECDAWARDFMTAKVAEYANGTSHDYHEVLRKRSMGLALAALILDEITPIWGHGGDRPYFLAEDRLQPILGNTPLPVNDEFWVFTAALLIAIFRQRGIPIDAPAMSAYALTRYLMVEYAFRRSRPVVPAHRDQCDAGA